MTRGTFNDISSWTCVFLYIYGGEYNVSDFFFSKAFFREGAYGGGS